VSDLHRTIHRLKTWRTPFQLVKYRLKWFEIRKDDRNYKTDDVLVLDEWNEYDNRYTDEEPLVRLVTGVLSGFGLQDGYVALSIVECGDAKVANMLVQVAPPRTAPPIGGGRDGG
jgi:hypothetical protein